MMNSEKSHASEVQGISLRELGLIFLKRKWIVISTVLAVLAVATLVSFMIIPTYIAVGQILIEREPNILSFEDAFQIEPFNDDYYQTQFRLLQSRALAAATIDRARLIENEAFVASVTESQKLPVGDLKNDVLLRGKLIDKFLRRLSVRLVRQTRLVQASFRDHDPKFATLALNGLFESYIEMNIQRRFQATEQATDFLTTQIVTLQAEIESNEKRLQEYGKEKNIIALSNTENTVIAKLGELNKALTDAQINRVNKETYYNEIRVATPDYIPDALANPLIQKIREEYNRLSREYTKQSQTFMPDYPEIRRMKAELETARKAMEDETQALVKRAFSDYQVALTKERALAEVFNGQKREAFQLNSNAIQYNSLQIQVQNEKNLLESLMKRKSETDVSSRLKGLRTSNVWVVDKAEVPVSPSSPNKKKNMILALLAGLIGGLTLAFIFDRLDSTIKDSDDVQKYAGMPMLGMVPAFSGNGPKGGAGAAEKGGGGDSDDSDGRAHRLFTLGTGTPSLEDSETKGRGKESEFTDLIVHFSPRSSFSEHYRSIRTTLLLMAADGTLRSIAVMSALPREGKTATVCNLAVALAQADRRVLIIDGDLRKPRLHRIFRVKNLNGLTKYLTTDVALEEVLRATSIPRLSLINAGPVPPNPAELLGSRKVPQMIETCKDRYDFILVDTPPVLAVSDALVLGPWLDGVIMVVHGGKTPRDALKRAKEKLDAHRVRGTGVILNNVRAAYYEDYYARLYDEYGSRIAT